METLIILFIIYSLFQWLFSDNKNKKKRQQRKQQQQQSGASQQEQEAPQSWEEAMKELESIFSGEPSKPEPKPEPKTEPFQAERTSNQKRQTVTSDAKARESFSDDPFSDDLTTRRRGITETGDSILEQLEADSKNPIYSGNARSSDLDYGKAGGVSIGEAKTILEEINTPESARRAIIMKEILDKPRARRPYKRIV